CELEKEVTVDLPAYKSQLVVEGYVEKDSIIRVSITESIGIFESLRPPIISDALVTVTWDNQTDTLSYYSLFESNLFYPLGEYRSQRAVRSDYQGSFLLQIWHKNRYAKAETTIQPPVSIDTAFAQQTNNGNYFINAIWKDPDRNKENYYRIIFDNNKPDSLSNFPLSDRLSSTERTQVGGGNFEPGDTVVVRLYHIDFTYYNYLRTVRRAIVASGSPFLEPQPVDGNIQGGLGIFTGLTQAKKLVFIPE
ncbi:MAG: DUF4249 domain-containing protein, partial [Bacteroidia bacterium]|nr:DUF4249 domain-containing protein [Bacteroidia bacterium]